jgi:hypothetical protein
VWHLELLTCDLSVIFFIVYRVDIWVGACFEVLLNLDDTIPSLFVLEIPLNFVQVFIFKHVQEVIAVVEDCDYLFIRSFIHVESGACRWFYEKVLVVIIPVSTFHKHPAVLPPAFLLIFIFQIRHIVHPNIL